MSEEKTGPEMDGLLSNLPDDERAEMGRAWSIASAARDDHPTADEVAAAFEKVGRRLRPGRRNPKVIFLRAAAVAAALVLGMFLGMQFSSTGSESHGQAAQAQYLLLIWNDAPEVSPDEHDAVVAEFRDWAIELARDGRLVDAAELLEEGSVAQASHQGVVLTGLPMIEERATGYFLIRASSRAEAEAIARECPHLKRGGSVEVREIRRQ